MAKGPKPAPCWLPGLLPWAHSGLTKNQVTSLGQHLEKRWKSPCSLVAPNSEKNSPGNLHAYASGSLRGPPLIRSALIPGAAVANVRRRTVVVAFAGGR